jgi:hypothetical protein
MSPDAVDIAERVAIDYYTWHAQPDDKPYLQRRDGYLHLTVHAGTSFTEHSSVAGAHSWQAWSYNVDVYVSPTGRSVNVWINGEKVKMPKRRFPRPRRRLR